MYLFRHYLQLIRFKASADLQSDRNQSYLGILWWILDPLLYLGAFYLIFEVFLNRGGEGFVGFLLCGLVFWRWFDACIKQASVSIFNSASLINQVYLPKLMFPVSEMVISSYRFGFVFVLLIFFMALYRGGSFVWLALPVVMLCQLVLTLGLGIFISLAVPFLPDIRKVLDSGMMLMFYMSGVFFDITKLSPDIQRLLSFNPMATLIMQYRKIFMLEQWPDWWVLFAVGLTGISILALGVYAGIRLDKYYPRLVR